jgi:hypothetical protein
MFTRMIVVAGLVLSAARPAGAQVVKFTGIRDAVPGRFFKSLDTMPNPDNENELIIGFNGGLDPATFTRKDFSVNTQAFGNRTATDTIRFVVSAPDGFYVAKLTYVQRGTAAVGRTATQTATAQWTVAGFPASLGVFNGDPGVRAVADLTELKRTRVPVEITVSLFAGATGFVSIDGARVIAVLAPLPAPVP